VAVTSAPRYTGPSWSEFSPTTIVVVNVSTTVINNFTLIDVDTGDTFSRQAGGALGTVTDTDAPPLPTPTPTTPVPPEATTTTGAPSTPSSLQDVVGTYGNLKVTPSGDCGGFTPSSEQTFQVTVADPANNVVTIVSQGQSFSGTLAPDYTFQFKDSSSTATLDGRFQQQGGTVVMSGGEALGACTITFSANKTG
jgi:hypothetical protein